MSVNRRGDGKKDIQHTKKRVVVPAGKRVRLVAIGLLLGLVMAGTVFARWGGLFATQEPQPNSTSALPSSSPTPQSLTVPSKEFFYANGKLVATEEPGGSSGGTARKLFDFEGDSKADSAIFRASDNTWYINNSSGGPPTLVPWFVSGDKLVPADYDGDGKADIAVYRPSNGTWYIRSSINAALIVIGWGLSGDVPIEAAYIQP